MTNNCIYDVISIDNSIYSIHVTTVRLKPRPYLPRFFSRNLAVAIAMLILK